MITANSRVSGNVYRARPARRYREYTAIRPAWRDCLPLQPTDPVFLVSDTINRPYGVNDLPSSETHFQFPRTGRFTYVLSADQREQSFLSQIVQRLVGIIDPGLSLARPASMRAEIQKKSGEWPSETHQLMERSMFGDLTVLHCTTESAVAPPYQ